MLSDAEVSHFLDPDQRIRAGILILSVSLNHSVPREQKRLK